MTVKRTDIRKYVVDMLAAEPQTEARGTVFNGKIRSFSRADLPCLNVFTPDDERDESAGYNSKSHKTRRCTLVVFAAIAPDPDEDLVDILDSLAGEVEGKLDADRSLGGLATYTEWRSTVCDYNPDADVPHGIAQIVYDVHYLN